VCSSDLDPNAINTLPDARSPAGQNVAPAPATPVAPAAAPAAPAPPPVAITRNGLDLNTAPEAELVKLVGKTLVKRVMAFRPYTSVQDLIKAGVSQKVIDKLKPTASAVKSATK
jgi:DNA uptake protein ComE-like DNA-binding protein